MGNPTVILLLLYFVIREAFFVFVICSLLENLPEDVSPGQAIWCPEDLGVICVGWWHVPYRLGRVYCQQRRSALFHISLKNFTCTTLGPTDRAVSNPVFSPDQTKLVFLENDAGGPHRQCSRLAMCDWCVFCYTLPELTSNAQQRSLLTLANIVCIC